MRIKILSQLINIFLEQNDEILERQKFLNIYFVFFIIFKQE